MCLAYKEWPKPDFFQGPQIVMYKEPSKLRNHKYPDVKDDDPCYEVAAYPPKPEVKEPTKRTRKSSDLHSGEKRKKGSKISQIREEKGFDIKEEKRLANKVWNEMIGMEGAKKQKSKAALKRDQQKQAKQRQQAKELRRNKGGGAKDDKKKRVNYEEYMEIEEEIKKGIENGLLFEGYLRVNPNNRTRAFVSVDGLKTDVMVDGLTA